MTVSKSGSVASQSPLTSDQSSGKAVPVPEVRTILSLNVSGRTDLRHLQGCVLLNALLRGVDRIAQDLEVTSGHRIRCRFHRCRCTKRQISQDKIGTV